MSNSNIEERVKKIIVDMLGVKPEDVVPEASFVDDLGADSLDTVELVMALEEEFGTDIPDEEAEKINTVQAALHYQSQGIITFSYYPSIGMGIPSSVIY